MEKLIHWEYLIISKYENEKNKIKGNLIFLETLSFIRIFFENNGGKVAFEIK